MKRYNTALFLATVASSALYCSYAQAQTSATASNDGEAALHGTGATSIQNLLVQELNCLGGYSDLGRIGTSTSAGTTSAIAEPTNLPLTTFNCGTTDLFPGFAGRYIASGSGTGRGAWRVPGKIRGDSTVTPIVTTAFTIGSANPNPFGTWNTVQFAFGDSSITAGDLNIYINGNPATPAAASAQTIGGAPVMFPKYVLPVAIAYSPVYGRNETLAKNYTFNIQFPQNILGTAAGGLRMSQSTYCKVFNGQVKNFNDAAFTADNGGVSLADAAEATDNPGRWAADGVPVRLVGRLDRSGTTDIFTRALAAQCGTTGNNYKVNAETLPYNRSESSSTLPNFAAVRSDTGLQPTSTEAEAGNGTATLVGAEYWDGSAIVTPAANAGKPSSQPSGANGSGRFLVADGSGRVASAILFAPDYASPSKTTVKLNGKIGYIGADFIDGSPTASTGLKAAALQGSNTSGNFVMPSAQNATNAFGTTILPPQSASDGTLSDATADTRQVRIYNNTTKSTDLGNATRSNPLAWYDVLYAGTGLANPSTGYPITGTTQLFAYTCYKADSTGSNATAMINFLAFSTDYVATLDGNGVNRMGVFTRNASTFANAGLLARSNIGALPDNWKHAIRQTFLVNSTETSSVNGTLGGYRLFFSNGGTSATNTTCTGKAGI
jgi:phosphate transport system substrate-binding protein